MLLRRDDDVHPLECGTAMVTSRCGRGGWIYSSDGVSSNVAKVVAT